MATSYKLKTLSGTAAAPAYTFEDDANSGMYSVSGDVLGLSTGGALSMSASTTSFVFNTADYDACFSIQSRRILLPIAASSNRPQVALQSAVTVGLFMNTTQVDILAGGDDVASFSADAALFQNISNVYFSTTNGIALKETTAASVSALTQYGKLYVNSSDNSLYYVNESGVTFIVSMTAV